MSRIKAALICLTAANFVLSATTLAGNTKEVSPSSVFPKRSAGTTQSYVVGPGDYLYVEVSGLPELTGSHSIGPDGVIYLPLIRDLYVEGLSIPQLKAFFTEQYGKFVINPIVYVSPIAFRSVRVFLDGEVGRPGYYTLNVPDSKTAGPQLMTTGIPTGQSQISPTTSQSLNTGSSSFSSPSRWPTLFDGLKAAGGFTLYSDISKVTVIRRQPLGSKASKQKATIDFSRLIIHGDETVNIRLFDGDVVNVSRVSTPIKEQVAAIRRSNISPDAITVYVDGQVLRPGPVLIAQGATLNQAIASAGGPKLLRGPIDFVRFDNDGNITHSRFSYDRKAAPGEYKNPILASGDVIRINDSLLSTSIDLLNLATGPVVGVYSLYSIFK